MKFRTHTVKETHVGALRLNGIVIWEGFIHEGGAYTRGLYTKEGLYAAYTRRRGYTRLIHKGGATSVLFTKEGLIRAAYRQKRGLYTRLIHKGGAYTRGL